MTTTTLTRTVHLARWNAVLLGRNRLALTYAVVMPLTPLLLLRTGDRGDPLVGASAIGLMLLLAGLFPVYYNILSQFVSRRDELVLKRMRTGETRDAELVASIALPGALCALFLTAAVVPISAALGQPLPTNPIVYVVLAVAAITMFTAFAYWTAAWTRSAEAAQLTSMPIILLASFGPLAITFPGLSDGLREAISWTPGAAITDLVRAGWFGFDGPEASKVSLDFAGTWGASAEPLLVIALWTGAAIWLARRSMRWEPRT